MNQLSEKHLRVLMKLMRHAEYCFEAIADNEVISHVFHAKQIVPFKTMNATITSDQLHLHLVVMFSCNVTLMLISQ
jgi:hypothetical protein